MISETRKATGMSPTLIDIVFCMLIMFLLPAVLASTTTTEARERTLPPIALAEMRDSESKTGMTSSRTVALTVGPGPTFFIDSEEVTFLQLSERLAALGVVDVEIRGDTSVSYGVITKVLSACQENGISRVALTYKVETK